MRWEELIFWKSGEYQVVEEHLADILAAGHLYNPAKHLLFRAMELTPFDQVRVCWLGQDPYPSHHLASGLAFSTLDGSESASIKTIYNELSRDLGVERPSSGNLEGWAKQGVLLWNVYPSCLDGRSLTHRWPEWEILTKEVLVALSSLTKCVFVASGSITHDFCNKYIDGEWASQIIYTSHPSPRGQMNARKRILGSRLFSTINAALTREGLEPIKWGI